MTSILPADECSQPPPEQLLAAIDEFNRGQWFECHETLEDLWVGESGLVRDLYQGLLQVAVALHHWQEGNFPGAILLLQKSVKLLGHVATVCQHVDVAGLIRETDLFRQSLENLGPERMEKLDRRLIPVVRCTFIR